MLAEQALAVDSERLEHHLATLATFSDAPAPAVTRVLYSDADVRARAYLKDLIAEVGLSVREDAIGNLFARLPGQDDTLPAVATGSHIDAIPHSGRYDGTVGVLGGLEALRALKEAGVTPKRPIELIMFTAEEPTRFGVGCVGSRALAGVLSADDLRALKDEDGRSFDDVRTAAGFTGRLEEVGLEPGHYHHFVELHIEQGPHLEAQNLNIGVVDAIAAPATLHITVHGQGGHAGAVLMPHRHDALVAGAILAQAVEDAARSSGAEDTVATVGIFDVHPRAVNSIPSRVFMSVDARDTDAARRDEAIAKIRQAAERIAQERDVRIDIETLNADPPATCGEEIVGTIREAAEGMGLAHTTLVSRAYHDALFMDRICPIGMVFIPCHQGISHRPDEYSAPDDIANGVRVLAQTLANLAS
ncbi:MAG: M20 family metallo-hydrolase [Trueperaceae bacterium]|nr:M20 family metallo-hydrolase [Trueperaceae bacterium]